MNLHNKLKWETIVNRLNKDKRFGEFRILPGWIYKFSKQQDAFLPCCNTDLTSKYEFINDTCN